MCRLGNMLIDDWLENSASTLTRPLLQFFLKYPIRNVRQKAHPLIGTSCLTLEIWILRLSEELVCRRGELSILSVIRKFLLIFIKIASVEKSYFDVTSIEGSEEIDAAFLLWPNEKNLKRISTTNWKTLVRVFFDFIFCSMQICLIRKSFFKRSKIEAWKSKKLKSRLLEDFSLKVLIAYFDYFYFEAVVWFARIEHLAS